MAEILPPELPPFMLPGVFTLYDPMAFDSLEEIGDGAAEVRVEHRDEHIQRIDGISQCMVCLGAPQAFLALATDEYEIRPTPGYTLHPREVGWFIEAPFSKSSSNFAVGLEARLEGRSPACLLSVETPVYLLGPNTDSSPTEVYAACAGGQAFADDVDIPVVFEMATGTMRNGRSRSGPKIHLDLTGELRQRVIAALAVMDHYQLESFSLRLSPSEFTHDPDGEVEPIGGLRFLLLGVSADRHGKVSLTLVIMEDTIGYEFWGAAERLLARHSMR